MSSRLAMAIWLGAPVLAQAHAYIERSDPAPNAVLPALPGELKLRYSEPVEAALVKVTLLRGEETLPLPAPPAVDADRRTVRVKVDPPTMPAGAYTVRWSIVARDGHPTQGRFSFRVGAR